MTEQTTFAPERLKAFVDAVVAIAMTLLILPLLESVSDVAKGDVGTGAFLSEHSGQLVSFGLSFVLIAVFWIEHHRQYAQVKRITSALLWINVAWMLTIVWLPVPTAMLGQMPTDSLQPVLYIGTLIMTQVTTMITRVYLLRHPEITDSAPERLRRGVTGDVASIILFLVAMVIAATVHPVGYYALLLVALSGPFERMLLRRRR